MSHDRPSTGPVEPGVFRTAATQRDVAELRRRFLRAVARYCPQWLADQQEDIAQVATVRFLELQERSGGRELLPAYIDRMAYGCTIDEIRRQRRRLGEVPVDDHQPISDPRPGGADPERSSVSREIGRGIRECLQTLVRPRCRAVTLYLQGHSVPSIGRILGWSTSKAESLVYRGLGNLRRCLAKKGLTP